MKCCTRTVPVSPVPTSRRPTAVHAQLPYRVSTKRRGRGCASLLGAVLGAVALVGKFWTVPTCGDLIRHEPVQLTSGVSGSCPKSSMDSRGHHWTSMRILNSRSPLFGRPKRYSGRSALGRARSSAAKKRWRPGLLLLDAGRNGRMSVAPEVPGYRVTDVAFRPYCSVLGEKS